LQAASNRDPVTWIPDTQLPVSNQAILNRLQAIEVYLGFNQAVETPHTYDSIDVNVESEEKTFELAFNSIWKAVAVLQDISPSSVDPKIWSKSLIRRLWLS